MLIMYYDKDVSQRNKENNTDDINQINKYCLIEADQLFNLKFNFLFSVVVRLILNIK